MPSRHAGLHQLIYVAFAVALVCAGCVFFSLYHRDTSWFLGIASPAKTAFAVPPPTTAVPPSKTPESAAQQTALTIPDDVAATPSRVHAGGASVKNDSASKESAPLAKRFGFALKHTKLYQSVGPIKVRLLRTNVRHSNADLSVVVDGHRTDRKSVTLDEPLSVALPKGNSGSIAIVLYGLTKDQVTGVVIETTAQQ